MQKLNKRRNNIMAVLNLERIGGSYQFKTSDQNGHAVITDSTLDGPAQGMSPFEMLLAATVTCSSIDVVMILEKQRQKLKDIKVKIEGNKIKKDHYSEWESLHMHFDLYGDIKDHKAKQAIELSVEKYCSVGMAMKKTTTISYSYAIHPAEKLIST